MGLVLRFRSIFVLLPLSLLLPEPPNAFSGGYAIPHQTARAVGLSNAVTAGVTDPSAVYVNPAALTEVAGNELMAGLNYINVVNRVEDRNTGLRAANKHDDNFVPSLFANYHIPATDLTLGFGVYTPYGLATTYEERSIVRFGAIRSELRTAYFTPAVAWRVNPYLSLGGGMTFVHSSALFSRRIDLGGGAEGRVRLAGVDNGYTYTFGALLKPHDKVKFGLSYRGRVDLNFDDARAKVADAGGGVSRVKSKGTQVPLPPVISAGIHWQITPSWGAEFVYDYTRWSEFPHLKARFNPPAPLAPGVTLDGLFIEQSWKSTHVLRLGSSYRISKTWELRGGIAVDETPIPARTLGPSIPGADILTLNGGLGYQWGSLTFDLGYMAVFYKKRRVLNDVITTNGRHTYETFNNFVSFHLGYRF